MANQKQIEAVIRAVHAADLSRENKISVEEASGLVGVGLTTTTSARLILDHGTAEEIAAMRGGNSIQSLLKQVRARTGPLKQARPNAINKSELDRRAFESAVWKDLSQGIAGLTSLPAASEMVRVVRANRQRRKFVDDKILPALNWLTEFSDAWTK